MSTHPGFGAVHAPGGPTPLPHRGACERVLHLVDVENLLGGATFTVQEAAWVQRAYEAVAPMGTVNQVVVATSHWAAPPTWFAWSQSARRRVRSGSHGADHELLAVMATEEVACRFDRIVIGSGDGIFAFGARGLQNQGCRVSVVSRRESLSRELRRAVRAIRFLAVPLIELVPRPSAA